MIRQTPDPGPLSAALSLLAALVAALWLNPVQADERVFDRSGYGQTSLPLWSPLTEFEYRTVSDFQRAEQNDADALFALFVLASGNVRSDQEFRQVRAQFEQGLQKMQPAVGRARSERERAEIIHHGLHDIFYQASDPGDILSAYDADQSQITRIFSDGIFNCISSSLLYIATARHFGLNTSGVLLPSHAYVQVNLADGSRIAVETTSPGGFDQLHDREFYERNAQWFRDRDLQAPDYEDHLQRSIVTAAELGLENMWNQHALAERMDYRDRMRLAEIKGHLQPDNHEAQKNRMLYYTREFEYLDTQQDHTTLLRMFQQIDDYMRSLETLAARPDVALDTDFVSLVAWLQAAKANTMVASEQPERGLQLARAGLAALPVTVEEAEAIRNNLHVALARYADRRTASQAFSQARQAFAGLEHECADNAICSDALTRVYAEWAAFYWSFQDYESALSLYKEYFTLDLHSNNTSVIRSNMASAYVNLAEQQWLDEDREGAVETLNGCAERLPDSICPERLQVLRQAGNL